MLSEETMQALFLAYKNAGIIRDEVPYDEFRHVTLEVLPPGTPDPDQNRR